MSQATTLKALCEAGSIERFTAVVADRNINLHVSYSITGHPRARFFGARAAAAGGVVATCILCACATFAWKSPKLSMPTSSARSRGHQPPLEASATPRSFEFILVAIDVGGRFGARLPTGSGLAGHRASGGAMLVSGRGCLLSLRGATSPRRPLSRQEATFLQMM